MSLAVNLKLSASDEAFDPETGKSAVVASKLSPVVIDALHARDLQKRLVLAYRETALDEKLPIRQRLAIIVGAALILWALIGTVLYSVF